MILPAELLDETYGADWGAINLYISKSGNINAVSGCGDYLITMAAYNKNWGLVYYLVGHGADINCRARDGGSVLSCAAVSEDPGVVRKVLELGADIHIIGTYGLDIISSAVSKGNVDVVSVLIEYGIDVDAPNSRRYKVDPPLIGAVDDQNYEMVRALLAAGINTKCAGNRWSLSCAIAKQDPLMISILIEGGFNLNFRKNDFLTGNTSAGRFDHPLIEAAKVHDLESARKLLDAGIKPDHAGNKDYKTPLHYAARYGQLDMVKLLIEYGAAISYDRSEKSQFKEYELPLAGAMLGDHVDVVSFLLLKGANPKDLIQRDETSFTGVSFARANKNEEIIKVISMYSKG